jgi:hypothetical protein
MTKQETIKLETMFTEEERKLLKVIRHKPLEPSSKLMADLYEKVSLRQRLKMAVQPRHIRSRDDVVPVLDGEPLDKVSPEQREAYEIQEYLIMLGEKVDLEGTTVLDLKLLKDSVKPK